MTDLIADFCNHHHEFNGISEGRRRDQIRILRELEASLGGRSLATLTGDEFRTYLISRPLAPSTILKAIKLCRPVFKFMHSRKHIDGDRLIELMSVKAPRGASWAPPKPYSRGEITKFWAAFEDAYPWTDDKDPFDRTPKRGEYWVQRWQENSDKRWEWNRVEPYARRLQAEAILALALFGGLRRVEIHKLTVEDCHYQNAYVRVMGAAKNREAVERERAVPMAGPMRVALANWLEFREQVLNPAHGSPWLSLWKDRALDPMAMSTLAHLLAKVGDGYSLHRMRHTYATERYRADMPVEILQKALGHASIAQTLQYAKIGDEDVIRSGDLTNAAFTAALARPETER